MKDRCDKCKYAKVSDENVEYDSISDMFSAESFLLCGLKQHHKEINRVNIDDTEYVTIVAPRVEDDYSCSHFAMSKQMADDIKNGCRD